jgi:hypothetical protein
MLSSSRLVEAGGAFSGGIGTEPGVAAASGAAAADAESCWPPFVAHPLARATHSKAAHISILVIALSVPLILAYRLSERKAASMPHSTYSQPVLRVHPNIAQLRDLQP